MSKFLELVGVVVKTADIDMGLEKPDEQRVGLAVKPAEIYAVREGVTDVDIPGCVIYLKSGETFWVTATFKQVLDMIDTWAW